MAQRSRLGLPMQNDGSTSTCRSYGAWPGTRGTRAYKHGAPDGAFAEPRFPFHRKQRRTPKAAASYLPVARYLPISRLVSSMRGCSKALA